MDLAKLRARFDNTLVGEVAAEFVRIGVIDRSLAMASKLFVAVIPLSIILAAVVPGTEDFGESFARRFKLSGVGAEATRALFATSGQVKGALSAIGLLILVYSVFSFTRGLQSVYLDIWLLQPQRTEALLRRGYWVLGFIGYTMIVGPLRDYEASHGVPVLYFATLLLLGFGFWLFTPWLLLGGRIAWQRLVPTAAVSAIFITVFMLGSELFLPTIFTRNALRYGLIGIAFGIVTWLFAYASVVVVAAIITGVWDRRRSGIPAPVRTARI